MHKKPDFQSSPKTKKTDWQLTSSGSKTPIHLLPKESTIGPDGICINHLYAKEKILSFDPGLTSTASCESAITFIDGNKSILLHRGYPIDQLCEHATYPEVAYLLLHGELPSSEQITSLNRTLSEEAYLHEQIGYFFNGFRRSSHPMAMLCGTMGALSSFYADPSADQRHMISPKELSLSAIKIIAKMPTLAAWIYRYRQGLPLIYPKPDLSYTENFLHMLFSMPEKPWKINPVIARAFDRIMILHIDHGQNASTSTVRMAGSTGVNPYACASAGMAALWGPFHGGANEAVLDMLEDIGTVENIPAFLAKVKDRKNPTRLMGFGHRVYKSNDPRAQLMRKLCHEILDETGINHDPDLKLALELEKIARQDDYFIQRNLFPNIDFYSGIILRALGLPSSLFTVFFAVARTAGWMAQWKEMVESDTPLSRPRQIYVGSPMRNLPEDFIRSRSP